MESGLGVEKVSRKDVPGYAPSSRSPARSRFGCHMRYAIPATLLGRTVALFAFFGELATPRLTTAPKTAGQALEPVVKMLSTRRECARPHLASRSARPHSCCSTHER